MDEIEWLFFDIGSTLVDESRVYERRFRQIAELANVPEDVVVQRATEYYKNNQKGDHEAADFFGVCLPKWESQYEVLYDDTIYCLKKLSKRFKIGVIATQDYGTEKRLIAFGIRQYLDLVIDSAEEGIAKPDLGIFRIALDRAHCRPEHSMMIGDRLDNDIVPAHMIGMKTVWVRRSFGGLGNPKTAAEQPDFTVNDLNKLLILLDAGGE